MEASTKEIKDFLHLYLGCEVEYPDTDGKPMRAIFTGFSRADGVETTYKGRRKAGEAVGDYLSWKSNGFHNCNANHLKPILRRFVSMTKEEAAEWADLKDKCWDNYNLPMQGLGELSHWLLRKHFDLFGLIEAGLALDKTQLSK